MTAGISVVTPELEQISPLTSPDEAPALRDAIYGGRLFLLRDLPEVHALVDPVVVLMERELGAGDVPQAQSTIPEPEIVAGLDRVRQELVRDPTYHSLCVPIPKAVGFEEGEHRIGRVFLRSVFHRAAADERDALDHTPHRDTWYGHPQCTINWWMPLFPVSRERSFAVFTRELLRPYPNASVQFASDLTDRVVPPSGPPPELDDAEAVRFEVVPGDLVLFSGAHLHATRPNHSGSARFSIDFRATSLVDELLGRGAPNVDNASAPRWRSVA